MRSAIPSISAVVIARNEQDNISSCLETLLWCDEIILVDMESEDCTVEIARKYTEKIYSHHMVTAFDVAKKFAVEKAGGDWILLIDADEMVPVTLAEELRRQSLEGNLSIVEIPFRHYILGSCAEYSGWGYTPLPRFFRKEAIIFTGIIHDYMHKRVGAKCVRLDACPPFCINHFNYRDSVHFVDKLNRYTSIEAQHLLDCRERFSYSKLLMNSFREFYRRYLPGRGFREGVRGFSLALMMAFYRALTWIKLWELYEFKNDPVNERYRRLREEILKEWRK